MKEIKRKLIWWLLNKLVKFNAYSDVKEAAKYYADREWIRHGYPIPYSLYPIEYCSIEFAWIDGYIKALHDNGLTFREGKIVKEIEKYS